MAIGENKMANTVVNVPTRVKLIKKENVVMEKTITKQVSIFETNEVVSMISFFAERMKSVFLGNASQDIRKALGSFYYDSVFNSADMDYISRSFDNIIKDSLVKAKGTKSFDLDIEALEQAFLSKEEIELYKTQYQNKEYTFNEIKAKIETAFIKVVNRVIDTLESIII